MALVVSLDTHQLLSGAVYRVGELVWVFVLIIIDLKSSASVHCIPFYNKYANGSYSYFNILSAACVALTLHVD